MTISKYLIMSVSLLAISACADSRTYVPPEQARDICTERADRFADSPHSFWGEFPDLQQVQDFYRSCYHAKTGGNPPNKYVANGLTLFKLGKVLHK